MMLPAQFGQMPSRRETQVAIGVLFGRSSKQIAGDLFIEKRTVDTYRYRLHIKLGAHNAVDLVRILMGGAVE